MCRQLLIVHEQLAGTRPQKRSFVIMNHIKKEMVEYEPHDYIVGVTKGSMHARRETFRESLSLRLASTTVQQLCG